MQSVEGNFRIDNKSVKPESPSPIFYCVINNDIVIFTLILVSFISN